MRSSLPLAVYPVLWLLACSPQPERAERGHWHVSGGQLRDAAGRAVVLRGVNLSGEHKRKPYLGYHREADFARVSADWSMNAVRFLVSWAAIEPARGQYDSDYLDRVARRMDWAAAAGLAVVLDMHQDVYGEGFGGNGAPRWTCDEALYAAHTPVSPWFANYTSPQVMACFDRLWTDEQLGADFAAAWRRLAVRLAHHPAVVGFDVINEPHWGSYDLFAFERDRLAPFYDRVVRSVREVAPHWVAFLEPASSRNLGIPSRLDRRSYADVVYAPHSYDPGAEAGGGFDIARRPTVLANIALLAREAEAMEAALWIGEYGGVSTDPGIVPYMDAQYDGAAAVGGGSMYWDYTRDAGYGLLDADGEEKPLLLDVLVRPYPARIPGDLVSFAYDEDARHFSVTYRPDRSIDAPGVIMVPGRVYPAGYRVGCAGCRWRRQPGQLLLTRSGPGQQVTLTVQPP